MISIIALLIGILLPALGSARRTAQAIATAANMRGVGQTNASYNGENDNYTPSSYVYGQDREGFGWNVADQLDDNPEPINGYVHWSMFLFDGLDTAGEAFEGPAVTNNGAPRTNPGPNEENWEPGQRNDQGQEYSPDLNQAVDRQLPRVAFGGNGAIFPRNKFSDDVAGERKNRLVKVSTLSNTSEIIFAAEYFDGKNDWRSISTSSGSETPAEGDIGNFTVKSHHPITPFFGFSSGFDVLNQTSAGTDPAFAYQDPESILDDDDPAKLDSSQVDGGLNMVGQPHSGKGNFLFVDGHVDQFTVVETIERRLWGERFYSLTGGRDTFVSRDRFADD
ncbi:MAG: H-X9-DG-CTERM domain-containing protein [Planctomycetota bacterium]